MSIQGLDFITKKDEVVPTFTASDLLRDPEKVEESYKRHVNTYVPINRAADGGEGSLSVDEFERKLIKAVKDARAPGGYITAEYGYGKTSTALYLWERAEESGVVVVPPFKLIHLPDLLTGIYAWVRYKLMSRAPHLVEKLEALYGAATGRSIEREAKANDVSEAVLRQWVEQGRFILEPQASEYITFFENVTGLVTEAGYDGLLVLPDEVQQYIEPRMKTSSDPIAPLFTLVDTLSTRAGYLKFGLVLIIPLKEVGVIREMRDDLLHRMRNFSLDLTAIYDDKFAENLWNLLAGEFDFRDVADRVVSPEALSSLGEIAARQELSNGPRTVVNAFHRMVKRFTSNPSVQPYDPIDLVDDFIGGAIPFAGNDQIPNVTRRALQNQIVRSDPERFEPAVKLAAAYPTNGVSIHVQRNYGGMVEALEELRMKALGELVISVGDDSLRGVTLFGLHIGLQKTDWFASTIRDFRRVYGEHHDNTRERTIRVFSHLLKTVVFKDWEVAEERPSTMASNQTIVFRGTFQSIAQRFPARRVHVRILWEDEDRKDGTIDGDVAVEYRLTLCSDLRADPERRRSEAFEATLDLDEHVASITLNMFYVRPQGIPLNIRQQLQDVWSPYDVSPLVLMNIYALLDEKREAKLIPESVDQLIRGAIQPELLRTVIKDLFNARVGARLGGVSDEHITENAVARILDARYGAKYKTLVGASNWRNTLKVDYVGALARLENIYQKRGEVEREGTKTEIANLLGRTSTSLDAFIKNFGEFLEVVKQWEGRSGEGSVRFTLHPLEQQILGWLQDGHVQRVKVSGKSVEVRSLEIGSVRAAALELGYLDEEIDIVIDLLERREIAETYQKHLLREKPSQTVDLDGVARSLTSFKADLDTLMKGFGSVPRLTSLLDEWDKFQKVLEEQRQTNTPDPQKVHTLGRAVQARSKELEDFAQEKLTDLRRELVSAQRTIRSVPQHYIQPLANRVSGSVDYVEQINVLRVRLLTVTQGVRAETESAQESVRELHDQLTDEVLSKDVLCRVAGQIRSLQEATTKANASVDNLDEAFKHYQDWVRIVETGSDLSEQLQQMGEQTQAQALGFADLSRQIRGEISSKSEKLDALPKHAMHAPELRRLKDEVTRVRNSAESQFIELQNRYSQALTAKGLYARDQMGTALTYNVGNPKESYRLLVDDVERKLVKLCERIEAKAKEERQKILNLAHSPSFTNMRTDDEQNLREEANSLIELAENLEKRAHELGNMSRSHEVLLDFPDSETGAFHQLIIDVLDVRDRLGEASTRFRTMDERFQAISLTHSEEQLLGTLPVNSPDDFVDLVEWRQRSNATNEDFWRLLQSLYDKRHIRINVGKVRK
ncbi:MAG: hypothetical protein AELANPGJ_03630 [Anaerolineae bacterium]|nr:hypothetical protein [Anaerolineae bacterium]